MAKAKTLQADVVERAVRFRLNQMSFIPGLEGVLGQVIVASADLIEKYPTLGDVVGDVEKESTANDAESVE